MRWSGRVLNSFRIVNRIGLDKKGPIYKCFSNIYSTRSAVGMKISILHRWSRVRPLAINFLAKYKSPLSSIFENVSRLILILLYSQYISIFISQSSHQFNSYFLISSLNIKLYVNHQFIFHSFIFI